MAAPGPTYVGDLNASIMTMTIALCCYRVMQTTWRPSTTCSCRSPRNLRPPSSSSRPALTLPRVRHPSSDTESTNKMAIAILIPSAITRAPCTSKPAELLPCGNAGDPIGGCNVTSAGFAAMTGLLQAIAPLALILEASTSVPAFVMSTRF